MRFNEYYLNENKSDIGFLTNIEKDTISNNNFREVLFTTENFQLVLMALKPNEDIGLENHKPDQFFRIDEGSGKVKIADEEYDIEDGDAFIVPSNTEHNVIAGNNGLKLYAIYAPPQHEEGTIHKTKEDVMKDE